MTAVRPPSWPTVQTPSPGSGGARSAAQRAFFDAALTRAAPAATPTPVAQARQEPAPAAVKVQTVRVDAGGGDQPTRILRPGSLLDIKV